MDFGEDGANLLDFRFECGAAFGWGLYKYVLLPQNGWVRVENTC